MDTCACIPPKMIGSPKEVKIEVLLSWIIVVTLLSAYQLIPVDVAEPVGLVEVRNPLEAPACPPKSVPLPAGKDGSVPVGVLCALLTVDAATPVGVTVTV